MSGLSKNVSRPSMWLRNGKLRGEGVCMKMSNEGSGSGEVDYGSESPSRLYEEVDAGEAENELS
jgi:hypothetical protein